MVVNVNRYVLNLESHQPQKFSKFEKKGVVGVIDDDSGVINLASVTSTVTFLTSAVWSIVKTPQSVRDYNQKQRLSLLLTSDPSSKQIGFAVSYRF